MPGRLKFGVVGEERQAYRYPHLFQRQRISSVDRLVIGPQAGHVKLLKELSRCLPEPLRLLYVLVVPRNGDHEAGRYHSEFELSFDEVSGFLDEFEDFLEADGRHHLWIANPSHGTLVYDQHDLIYAYGPLNKYAEVLELNRLRPGNVDIPGPHWHAYHPEFDESESQVLAWFDWIHSPLCEADDP